MPKTDAKPEHLAQGADATSGREAHAVRKAAERERARMERRVEALEKEIELGESELADLRAKLVAGDADWEQLAEMAAREQSLKAEVDRKTEEWSKLAHRLGL